MKLFVLPLLLSLLVFSAGKVQALDFVDLPSVPDYQAEQTRVEGLSSTIACYDMDNPERSGRASYFSKNNLHKNPYYYSEAGKYVWTAVGLYFDYLAGVDFSSVKVSLFPASSPDTMSGPALVEDAYPDLSRIRTVVVDGYKKAYQVIFPLFRNINVATDVAGDGVMLIITCAPSATGNVALWERLNTSSGSGFYNYYDASGGKLLFPNPYGFKIAFSFYSGHPTPPSYKPVVLLREAGRTNVIWDSLVNELAYDKSAYVRRFEYDESQSIPALAEKLRDDVVALSNLSFSDWGDGKVDLVGYGLGGLIAERYLRDHPNDHHVRRFVAVAVPFKGTPLLNWSTYTGTVPRLGSWLNKKFVNGARDLLGATSGFNASTTAVTQMAEYKESTALPANVAVYSVAGNLGAAYQQNLFHFTAKRHEDLGDLFVPADSAQPAWLTTSDHKIFSEATNLAFTANLTKDSLGAKVEFLGPEKNNLTFLHGKLLDVPAVRSAIKAYLGGNN